MDELDTIPKSKTGLIVVVVLVGAAVLGVGLFLAFQKSGGGGGGGGADVSAETAQWCKLRQEWARTVRPLEGELMVAGVKTGAEAAAELEKLVVKRNILCNDKAKALQALLKSTPDLWMLVKGVEEALIVEGKVRSNVAVEISNSATSARATTTEELEKNKTKFSASMKERLEGSQAKADEEVGAAMAQLKAKGVECSGIYRGPMTDQGTSGNPYLSWAELKVRRTMALKAFDEAVEALAPMEEYSNRVRHDLVSRYATTLKKCYAKAKNNNPEMSDKLGLRVRVDKKGKVAGLAIEWMAVRDEKILDCLVDTAGEWKLPVPDPEIEYGVVTLDFTVL